MAAKHPRKNLLNQPPVEKQEYRQRLSEDQTLRKAGFKIHTRPKTGSVLWTLEGKLYTHAEALAHLTSL